MRGDTAHRVDTLQEQPTRHCGCDVSNWVDTVAVVQWLHPRRRCKAVCRRLHAGHCLVQSAAVTSGLGETSTGPGKLSTNARSLVPDGKQWEHHDEASGPVQSL